jgi:hypothetical protein
MKKFISGFIVLILAMIISFSANAAPGDTFVQVDFDISGPDNDQCSILKVAPDGTLSEFASFEDITDLTGEPNCDFDDTGMTVADNGDVYFSEDESDTIIKATPDGVLSTFVTTAQILAVTGGGAVDLDHAMEIGPDGDLYFIDEETNTLLKATIPGSVVSLVLSEAEIQAVTGTDVVDIDAGMAFDCDGNLYFVNNPENQELDSILRLTPLGNLSIFVDGQEIIDATGFISDIDSGVAFFDSLFIQDEGECDCIIKVTLDKEVNVFISEGQITTVTGNEGADPDGGIAVNQSREVIFGDDGTGPEDPEDPNVLKSNPNGTSLSLFVSTQQLEDFYQSVDFEEIGLKGSIAIEGVDPCAIADIPTLSEWGLIAMAGILGIVGYLAIRRRKVTA